MNSSLQDEILKLKEEKNAIILAHNYQPKEIQEIADFLGDSLELCIKASEIDDKEEDFDTIFEIGPTGNLTLANVFNLDDIVYKGPNASADILIDYYFITERGEYKEIEVDITQ